jgi:uncharacterized protein (TIGR03435 family)
MEISVLALLGLAAAGALAQRLEFEVVSVKQNTNNGQSDWSPRRSGDLVTMHNTQPGTMIGYAYHITASYQLAGFVQFTPDEANWYDVDARIGRDASDDEVRRMFQSLLADRFKLKIHRETRELPVYELTIAKGQPRLESSGAGPMNLTIEGKHLTVKPGECSTSMWNDGSHIICHGAAMERIVAEVSGGLYAPVVDRTGLTGTYDLHVRYMPEGRKLKIDAEAGPSLQQAFPDETGIKLEKGKGPVEVLVIDHVEKPTGNQ